MSGRRISALHAQTQTTKRLERAHWRMSVIRFVITENKERKFSETFVPLATELKSRWCSVSKVVRKALFSLFTYLSSVVEVVKVMQKCTLGSCILTYGYMCHRSHFLKTHNAGDGCRQRCDRLKLSTRIVEWKISFQSGVKWLIKLLFNRKAEV